MDPPRPSPYMAQPSYESSRWPSTESQIVSSANQQLMLSEADIPWSTTCDASVLPADDFTYEICQQPATITHRQNLYADAVMEPYQVLSEELEDWNLGPSTSTALRSYTGFGSEMDASQLSLPLSDIPFSDVQQNRTVVNAAGFHLQPSIEYNSLRPAQMTGPYGQSMAEDLDFYCPSRLPSATPVMSEQDMGREESFDIEDINEDNEKPYAQLIWQALLTAPNHSMQLADIYDWIERKTEKVKEKAGAGWRNSIRHNLSMNKAFEKTCSETKSKKGGKNTWRLLPDFVENGPESTTRYRRKEPNFKRARKSVNPAPQRQASGAKGGQAAKKAAEQRRSALRRETLAPELHGLGNRLAATANDARNITSHGPLGYPTSPSVVAEQTAGFRDQSSSPYFTNATVRPRQILYSQHSVSEDEYTDLIPHASQSLPMFGSSVTIDQHQISLATSDTLFGSRNAVDAAAYGYIDRITFRDLENRSFFTSDGDSPDSLSETSQPLTPSTASSMNDGFGGAPSNVMFDPSPFEGTI